MARRPEVGSLSQPTLRPVATPVDSFVNPRAGQGLSQIAQALGELAPSLSRIAAAQIEEAQERGKADATSIYEDIKATGKKIKSGEIAPHESKWYQAAAREQVGRLMAASYGQDLLLFTQTDEDLSNSVDPQDFDRREAEHRKQWLEEHADMSDPAFRAGFNTTSAQGILNARQSFVAQAANRMDGKVLDNTYAEHQVTIQNAITAGQTVQEMAAAIRERNGALYRANPKLGKALSQTTIEAVFDAARAFENPELIKILDHIEGGAPGSKLGQTRDAMSKRDEVEREIRVNRQNRLAAEEKDEKRERQKNVDAHFDEAWDRLESDPRADVADIAKRLLSVDPTAVPQLLRLSKAIEKASDRDDPAVYDGLWQRAIDNDLDLDEVSTALEAGSLTIKSARELKAQIRANRSPNRGSGARTIVQDPYYNDAQANLRGHFFNLFGTAANAMRESADRQMRREWIQWRTSPAGASVTDPNEINDWLDAAIDRNVKRFASVDLKEEMKSTPKPDRPASAGPSLPDWEVDRVSPWPERQWAFLEQAYSEVVAGRRTRFPTNLEQLINTFKLTTKEDILRFIQTQRRLSQR